MASEHKQKLICRVMYAMKPLTPYNNEKNSFCIISDS